LAWTHSRSNYFPFDASFDVARDFGRELFLDRPTNILLVKFNYWLSLYSPVASLAAPRDRDHAGCCRSAAANDPHSVQRVTLRTRRTAARNNPTPRSRCDAGTSMPVPPRAVRRVRDGYGTPIARRPRGFPA